MQTELYKQREKEIKELLENKKEISKKIKKIRAYLLLNQHNQRKITKKKEAKLKALLS